MFASGKNVKKRRLKRKLKAAASIAVAIAAGTFLACQRGSEAIREAASSAKPLPKEEMDAGAKDALATAIVPYDGGKNDAAVDVREHRKGMPVPDNLLE